MGLPNFGCNRNDVSQAAAASLGTESRTAARLTKIFVIPRFTGWMAVERHGSAEHSFLHIRKASGSKSHLELGCPD